MGPKRRPNAIPSYAPTTPSSQMKFGHVLETGRSAAKGTKPLPDPITVPEIFTKVLVYGCKKVVFLDPVIRIVAYAVLLFFVSLIADYVPLPRTYFSSSSNVLNQYFVKLSWGWTISLLGIFIGMTSSVYCCGRRPLMSRHFCRILIATIIWFVWTSLFQVLEETTGQCLFAANTNTQTPPAILYSKGRRHCVKTGGKWTSLDISGHSFILIWCTLFITSECKAILGWDTIADFIRNEDHRRDALRRNSDLTSQNLLTDEDTPISHLSAEEFDDLKKFYAKFGLWAKIVFVALTLLTLLWDIMLIATASYYHVMIEKVLAGLIAVLMWICTYRGFYTWAISMSPGLPGVGLFKYSPATPNISDPKVGNSKGGNSNLSRQVAPTSEEVPSFMGMPLYPPRKSKAKDMIGASLANLDVISGPK